MKNVLSQLNVEEKNSKPGTREVKTDRSSTQATEKGTLTPKRVILENQKIPEYEPKNLHVTTTFKILISNFYLFIRQAQCSQYFIF